MLVALVVLAACASGARPPASDAIPRIESLEPVSGPAGEAYPLTLRIVGGPFDAKENVVRFGPAVVEGLPSEDGSTIVLPVPKSIRTAVEAPPMVLPAGPYEVIVETSAGRSEPALFNLVGGMDDSS